MLQLACVSADPVPAQPARRSRAAGSNSRRRRRALAAFGLVPLGAALACASHGATTRNRAPNSPAPNTAAARGTKVADTSSVAIGGGKTIERLFAGRFAGVTVQPSSDGGLQIRIRGGASSYVAGEEPLYVVDGTPLPEGTGGIVHLNPYDIDKIEVLKNPADVGIYGVRGANGVVRITTLRPGRR